MAEKKEQIALDLLHTEKAAAMWGRRELEGNKGFTSMDWLGQTEDKEELRAKQMQYRRELEQQVAEKGAEQRREKEKQQLSDREVRERVQSGKEKGLRWHMREERGLRLPPYICKPHSPPSPTHPKYIFFKSGAIINIYVVDTLRVLLQHLDMFGKEWGQGHPAAGGAGAPRLGPDGKLDATRTRKGSLEHLATIHTGWDFRRTDWL